MASEVKRNRAWAAEEIRTLLHYEAIGRITREIAGQLGRTVPAVNGKRRELKRLRECGIRSQARIVRLLAREGPVPVTTFVRRDRTSGRPVLVHRHERNPQS